MFHPCELASINFKVKLVDIREHIRDLPNDFLPRLFKKDISI